MLFLNNVPVTIDGTIFNVNGSESDASLETDEYLIRFFKDRKDTYMVSGYIKKINALHVVVEDVHVNSIEQIQSLVKALKSYRLKYERK